VEWGGDEDHDISAPYIGALSGANLQQIKGLIHEKWLDLGSMK
jgi:hypothetical protein